MIGKAATIDLLSMKSPPMRAFHLAWMAFFVCFFGWFACAPLMPLIKNEFHLTPGQIADINIAAVAVTILARLLVGPLCDRYGPRKVYSILMLVCVVPLAGAALAQDYTTFMLCRFGIGALGASFVITQYHTSVMFADNVVGTANATSAGWGNAGAGAAQLLVPLMLAGAALLGASASASWRLTLLAPALALPVMTFFYWRCTQDCPQGNYSDLRARGIVVESGKKGGMASLRAASRNYRVWMLFIAYAASFGVEVFIHNVAAIYYVDTLHFTLTEAGLAAGSFGLLAVVARPFGGILSDRLARRHGLNVRALLLAAMLLAEGVFLLVFAGASSAMIAVLAMLAFGAFTHMACGATYAVIPFVDRKALGGVAALVGAGGNVGSLAVGVLLKEMGGDLRNCLAMIGVLVCVSAACAVLVRFGDKTAGLGLGESAVQ